MVNIRSLVFCVLAICAILGGCGNKAAQDEPEVSFEAAAAKAQQTPTFDNIERARELFEAIGPAPTDAQAIALDRLAEKISSEWPAETIRLRMVLAKQPGLPVNIAQNVIATLGSASLDTTTRELIASNPAAISPAKNQLVQELQARVAARDTLAATLAVAGRNGNAQRLIDILVRSEYSVPESQFWAQNASRPAVPAVAVAQNGNQEDGEPSEPDMRALATRAIEDELKDPISQCENAQFTRAQFIGNAAALAEKYGPENEVDYDPLDDAVDDSTADGDAAVAIANISAEDARKTKIRQRNQTMDRRPGPMLAKERPSEYFLRLGFTSRRVPHPSGAALCRPSVPMAMQAQGVALALARQAGVDGDIQQDMCIGHSAVLLLGTDEMSTVVVVTPDAVGAEVLIADDLDGGYLRKIRGKSGKELLLVGNRAGAHGYASANVFDLTSQTRLFGVNGLHFGNIVILAGSPADGDTLGLQFAVAEGREDCGQCAQYRKFVALDPSDRGYKVSSEVCSIQELPSQSSGFMSLNAMATVINQENFLGIGSYANFAKKMLQSKQAPADIALQIAKHLEEVSNLQKGMGDFANMQYRSEEALEVLQQLPPYDKVLRSRIRHFVNMNLMEALMYQAQYERAIALGEKALLGPDINLYSGNKASYANRLSVAHLMQGTFRPALKHLQVAMASVRAEDRAPTWGNMAWYSNMAKDYDQGARFATKALSAAVRRGGRVGINARFLAESRFAQGNPGEALDWINYGAAGAALADDATDLIALQMGAANIAESINETRLGILLLEQALVSMDEQTWSTEGGDFLLTYSRLLQAEGRHADAMTAATRALGLTANRRTNIRVEALILISKEHARRGDAAQALAAAKLAFLDSMKVARSWAGETYQLTSAEFARRAADWYFSLLLKGNPTPASVFRDLALWKGFVLKEGLFPDESAKIDGGIRPDPRSLLRNTEIFVDYFIGNQTAFAISVTPETLRLIPLKVRAGEIARLSQAVQVEFDIRNEASRNAIARNRLTPQLHKALRVLHTQLIQPIQLHDPQRYLFISPDNAVGTIPWSALLDVKGEFIGEKFATLLIPGAFLLEQSAGCYDPGCRQRKLVGLAGNTQATSYVDRDQRRIPLAPLKYARREIAGIRELWPDRLAERTDLTPDRSASRSTLDWLRMEGGRLGVLHMVGHGVFNRQDPLESQLFIEPAATSGTRAFVTAKELAEMNFKGMEVAVISACESGSLDSRGGGEPLGLVRAFLSAGTSQVVASQWLIDDNAALVFTVAFHTHLASEKPIDALFHAQRITAEQFSHPYFWAPMQLYGRPLRNKLFTQ